jgi:cholesterol oxidase
MTGCRNNAKNTLPKNYLGLAEIAEAAVFALTTVTRISQDSSGDWLVSTNKTGPRPTPGETFSAKEVVIAAGTYNTQKLLHKMKDDRTLPRLSNCLGDYSRTNSESLVGATMPDTRIDFSQGSAITSSFFPDENTHVEPVRYGKGSNFMGLLQTIMTEGTSAKARRKQWVQRVISEPSLLPKVLNVRKWSQRTVIALVMQNVDSWIKVRPTRGILGWHLTSKNSSDHPNATWIPAANETARLIASKYKGVAGGHLGDLISAPFTAHFVGGAIIGDVPEKGVIDPYHRVWNYPGLHIVDGSTITANLGVNPSLTITAQAERALSMWPNKDDEDPRPKQGEPYLRIDPVFPKHPVVPKGASAEFIL